MAQKEMIRIRLKAYDHQVIDQSAEKIVETRDKYDILSIEELRLKAGLSSKIIEILRRNKVLDKLTETNQLSFF